MENNHQSADALPPRLAGARRWLISLIIGLLGIGAILIGLRLLSPTRLDPHQVMPPKVGALISDFELNDLQGRFVKLSDYRGKVVLVNAWAAWCAPCKAEMPLLDTYYQAHKQQGFAVLAVNAGDPPGFMNDFLKTIHPTFPVLLDPDVMVVGRFGIEDLPTSILVGRDGTVKQVRVGMYTAETLDSEVTPLLSH